MNRFQRIFGERAVRNRSCKIAATILLIVVIAAAMRSLVTNKDLHMFFISDSAHSQALRVLGNTHTRDTSFQFAAVQKNGDMVQPNTLKAIVDLTDASWKMLYSNWVDSVANFQHTKTGVLSKNKRLVTDRLKWDETNQQSCNKTNPDCLEGSSIMFRGSSNTLDNETCDGFVRELDAVIAAMNEYNPLSIAKDREYMGLILQCDGRYYYTVTPGQSGSDKASIRLQRWILRRATALWHTHGSYAREHKYFSDADTRLSNSLSKRFYLGDAMGNLRVFKPGGKVYSGIQARRMGLPSRRGFAAGNLVKDENDQAIEIANKYSIKPPDFRSDDSRFIVMCIRKST